MEYYMYCCVCMSVHEMCAHCKAALQKGFHGLGNYKCAVESSAAASGK